MPREGLPTASQPENPDLGKRLGPLAVVGMVLSKGKLLLLGLTKLGTLGSMVISFGAYAVAYGWQFALGLVLSIYVHDGARLRTDPVRDQGIRSDVHPHAGRVRSDEAGSSERRSERPHRAGWTGLGPGGDYS